MSFETEQLKQSSNKFGLVRIKPSRNITELVTDEGGGIYSYEFSYPLASVKQNGASLSVGTTPLSSGEYYIEENIIYLNPTDTPSSSNVIIVDYYILLANSYVEASLDPESDGTLYPWESRLTSFPVINQDLSNTFYGKLSISSSDIFLANTDKYFNKYLTNNDSFSSKEVVVWQCLGSISNIKKIFKGKTKKISLGQKEVIITCYNNFEALEKSAFMGDPEDECYFNFDLFPSLDPSFMGRPIKFVFGKVSKWRRTTDRYDPELDAEYSEKAVCVDYAENLSETVNRTWVLCKINGDTENFGSAILSVDNLTNPVLTWLTVSDASKFYDFMTFRISGSSGRRGNGEHSVLGVDVVNNKIAVVQDLTITTSMTITNNYCPTLFLSKPDGTKILLYHTTDYTSYLVPTTYNFLVVVELNNNLETSIGTDVIDPYSDNLCFRIHPERNFQNHSDILKTMIINAGLDVNTTSFNEAKTALNVNANFTIPLESRDSIESYYVYIEKLLFSTMGYIFLNDNFEIEYKLLESPSSSTVITQTDVIEQSFQVDLKFYDLYSKIVTQNYHYSDVDNEGRSQEGKASTSLESIKSKYLHENQEVFIFDNVLEDMTSVLTRMIKIKSNREGEYSLRTKQVNYLTNIGDDLLLTNRNMPNNENKEIKILSISKKHNQTNLIGFDIID